MHPTEDEKSKSINVIKLSPKQSAIPMAISEGVELKIRLAG
jgi:hypothetical protein